MIHFVLNPHPTLIPAIEAGSTATKDRITGFGGAPNMGADARGRRHDSPTWSRAGQEAGDTLRGRKLVVQMVQTRQPNGPPSFVERLDAFDLAASAGFALPPVMIYGDDVTHVVTERGVANLLRCRLPQGREAALRAVAGDTEFGKRQSPDVTDGLRGRGVVMFPSDLGIDVGTRMARGQDDRRPRDGLRRTLFTARAIPAACDDVQDKSSHDSRASS